MLNAHSAGGGLLDSTRSSGEKESEQAAFTRTSSKTLSITAGRGERQIFIGASLDDANTRGAIPAFVQKYSVTFPIRNGATADDLDKGRRPLIKLLPLPLSQAD
jgi:hypothetical protein